MNDTHIELQRSNIEAVLAGVGGSQNDGLLEVCKRCLEIVEGVLGERSVLKR